MTQRPDLMSFQNPRDLGKNMAALIQPVGPALRVCSAMFHTDGLFRELPCPLRDACDRPICLFSHNFSTVPVPAPAPTQAVPAKRRAPPELDPQQALPPSRPSSANAERPTKLRRAGPAAKPVAIPTASSSPVSKQDPCPIALPHWHSRPVFLSSRSMLGSQKYPFRCARYVTRLVSL
jgi:hypothetical protein